MNMLRKFLKILSLGLLLSLLISPPLLKSQGQQREKTGPSEITFIGKEERKWIEKREPPMPVMMGQGVKEEAWLDSFDLREDAIGPMRKMSPSATVPGCGYSGRFTRGMAQVVMGDKALYEQGRYFYFEGDYERATSSFQKIITDYPESPFLASAAYWLGETKFHQGMDGEALEHFQKVAREYPKSEYYEYSLYSSGWIRLQNGAFEEGYRFFHRVYDQNPRHPIAESSLFWSGYCIYLLGRYNEAVQEMESLLQVYPQGKWGPEAEYLMGVSYFRLRRFQESIGLFRSFLQRFPRHPWSKARAIPSAGVWSMWDSMARGEGSLRRC